MRPVRSVLYVPADKPDWVKSAPSKYDADGFFFDLEDAVVKSEKPYAREVLTETLPAFTDLEKHVSVRVNSEVELLERDLDAIIRPGLDSVHLAKLARPDQIEHADHLISYLERKRGIEDRIEIITAPETAEGLYQPKELCLASDRVSCIIGANGKGGDIPRDIGYEWTLEGREKLYFLSKVVLGARAAGVGQILSGAYLNIDDLDGLRQEARQTKQLGYTGYQIIHPSHIEPVNEVFSPDMDEVEYSRRLLDEVDVKGEELEAIRFEGDMIDTAHIKTAQKTLKRAKLFGLIAE